MLFHLILIWLPFPSYFHSSLGLGNSSRNTLGRSTYDDKIKEFNEMKLGQLTMEEYANKFLELLRYFRYIRDDEVKIQCFISGLPQYYKDRIGFDEPRTLEEAIRKAKYCYYQNKGKPSIHKAWKGKRNEKFGQRKTCFKPSNFRNQQR